MKTWTITYQKTASNHHISFTDEIPAALIRQLLNEDRISVLKITSYCSS